MSLMSEDRVSRSGPVQVELPNQGRVGVGVLALAIAILAGFGLGWLVYSNGDAEAELAESEALLAEITAERDVLSAQAQPDTTARRESVERVLAEVTALLDDPGAVGTEEEVADLLATHATSSAIMHDDVFGPMPYRTGFYNTLYNGAMNAQIDVHHTWVSDDGSRGGILWLWHGTNAKGNPFELAGISLTTHNDEGLITHELVTWPYPDDYVREAAFGEGT